MSPPAIVNMVIIGVVLVVFALMALESLGVLSLFAAIGGILRERKAERLAAEARREITHRRGD